jgi:hypothetical protein
LPRSSGGAKCGKGGANHLIQGLTTLCCKCPEFGSRAAGKINGSDLSLCAIGLLALTSAYRRLSEGGWGR